MATKQTTSEKDLLSRGSSGNLALQVESDPHSIRRPRASLFSAIPVLAAFSIALLAVIPAANADLFPSPKRPTWDQEPLPEPEPPPEKPLERVLVAGLWLGVLTFGIAAARRRARAALARPFAPHSEAPRDPARDVP